jgi:hypothetical protein
MASRICCTEGHSTKAIPVGEAAIALAEGRAIGTCRKCGKALQYRIEHTYENDPKDKEYIFVVTGAARLAARTADSKNVDAFLLTLRDMESGKELILPTFWDFGSTRAHRGAHPAPMLSLEGWKRLFRQLNASLEEPLQRIRERAYQLYEQRGRLDGYDVADWLQAEAEINDAGRVLAAAA